MQATTPAKEITFYQQQFEAVVPRLRQQLLRMDLQKVLGLSPLVSETVMEKVRAGNSRLAIETLLTDVKTRNCWSDFFSFLRSTPGLEPFCQEFKFTPKPEESARSEEARNRSNTPFMQVKDGVCYDQLGNVIPGKPFAPGRSIGILIDGGSGINLSGVHVDGAGNVAINPTPATSIPVTNLPATEYAYNLQSGENVTLPAGKKKCAVNCVYQNNVTLGSGCDSIRINGVVEGTVTVGVGCKKIYIALEYQGHVIIQDNCEEIHIQRASPECTYSVEGENCKGIYIDGGKIC